MNNFVSIFEELSKLYEEDEKKVAPEAEETLVEDADEEIAAEEVAEEQEEAVEEETAEEAVEEEPAEEPEEDEEPKKLVLECAKCGNITCKEESEVEVDEESDLANVDIACEACEEAAGYKILGELHPYGTAEEPVEEEQVEEEQVEEALETDEEELTDPEFRGALNEEADEETLAETDEPVEEGLFGFKTKKEKEAEAAAKAAEEKKRQEDEARRKELERQREIENAKYWREKEERDAAERRRQRNYVAKGLYDSPAPSNTPHVGVNYSGGDYF